MEKRHLSDLDKKENHSKKVKSDNARVIQRMLNLLSDAEPSGDFAISGLAHELPSIPGLRVNARDFGFLAMPLNRIQVASLFSICEQTNKQIFELSPQQVELTNPKWNTQFKIFLERICPDLGCLFANIDVHFTKLQIHAAGARFSKHKLNEDEKNLFARLVVQLPSIYTGGEYIVYNNVNSCQRTLDFGCESGDASYSIQYAAYFTDLEHEMLEITNGYRAVLVYSLYWKELPVISNGNRLKVNGMYKLFQQMDISNRHIAISLSLDYKPSSFKNEHAMSVLKTVDKVRFDLLKNANNLLKEEEKFSFFIVHAVLITENDGKCFFSRIIALFFWINFKRASNFHQKKKFHN